MAVKNTKTKHMVDDVTFYKTNSFLVSTMTAIAGEAIRDSNKASCAELLKNIIDDHEKMLCLKLKEEPLWEMESLLRSAQEILKQRKGVSLEKAPVYFKHHLPSEHGLGFNKDYASEKRAISYVHGDLNKIWIAYKDNESKSNILTKNFEQYVPIAAGLLLINWLKQSPDNGKTSALLLCISALIKLDQLKLYALFRSKAYEDYAACRKGKRHSDELLKDLIPLVGELKSKAIDLWDNKDDQRWHAQMARDLTPEVNAPAIEKIVGELSKKYPRWETDENEKTKYKKEYKKRIKYETLSLGKATEVLYEAAKPFKKNRGPSPNKDEYQLNIEYFDHILSPDFHIPIDEDD